MDVRDAIFVPNNSNAPRLCPELAAEIGLNESVLLLQLEFWIRTYDEKRYEGRLWTYKSVRELREFFPFWGVATINRTVQSLERQKCIIIGNFNKYKYDRTRWFALDTEGLARLRSIRVVGYDGGYDTHSDQNGTGPDQNGTRPAQVGTTIPENTTKNTTIEESAAKNAAPPILEDPIVIKAKEGIQRAIGEFYEKANRAGVADPMIEEKDFVREYAPKIAAIMGRVMVCDNDRTVARRIFKKKFPLDKLDSRLEAYMGMEEFQCQTRDGKDPSPYWILNKLDEERANEWRPRPRMKSTKEKMIEQVLRRPLDGDGTTGADDIKRMFSHLPATDWGAGGCRDITPRVDGGADGCTGPSPGGDGD